jgi:hypothetical protein
MRAMRAMREMKRDEGVLRSVSKSRTAGVISYV